LGTISILGTSLYIRSGRWRWAVALALSGTAILSGCRAEAPAAEGVRAGAAATPHRIVALAPSPAETLFALGLGKWVVGVGDYTAWPPEAAGLPKLGGLLDPNFEQIVALKPDLAVVLPSQRDLAAKLGQLGIASLTVPSDTLDDVERSFALIADRCGDPAAGRRLTERWRREMAPAPLPGSPKVLLVVGRPPGRLNELLLAGPGTFLDALLVRMGAVNALADSPMAWPQVNLEEVLAHAPDAIVELRSEPPVPSMVAALRHDWQSLPGLPAVRTGRISVIGGSYTMVPGPRLPQLFRELRAALAGPAAPPPSEPKPEPAKSR
jgi:iron complex transport system substrate-binding protein